MPLDQTGTVFDPLPAIWLPKLPVATKLLLLTNALAPDTAVKLANATGVDIIEIVALTLPVTDTPVLVTVAIVTALLCNTKLPVRSPVWTQLVVVEVPADILLIFFS